MQLDHLLYFCGIETGSLLTALLIECSFIHAEQSRKFGDCEPFPLDVRIEDISIYGSHRLSLCSEMIIALECTQVNDLIQGIYCL